ncbi:MAG: acetylornithine/succinylornithine family transaminase [Actinobacteria bacterium]|nr:acetylornithine/succinylornithine family transaminase [Actinomycetota bacterium]
MSAHAFSTAGADYCPFMPVFGAPSVMFERGSGTELWDVTGKRYLDFLSGIAVVSLGHCNPAVSDAVTKQINTLSHVSNFFANPAATKAATDINQLLHETSGQWGQVFLCNSGAEANEVAIKLARKFGGRGRYGVVSALGSFHGRTLAALAATGQPAKHEPFQPMPEGFRHVPYGDLGALEASIDPSVAAVLIETVQGEGGVIPATTEYLRGIRRLCDERGLLMMIDEVQTGFARTGEWFGFQHAGIAPDVVTMAKGIGNGFPVGAAWARRDVAAVFQPGDHGSTYSGTAIAGAAVSAVIAEMRRIDAPTLAREKGEYFAQKLVQIDGVEAVRGQGLLRAAELGPGRDAKAVFTALLERGLVTNAVNATSLRLAPPITTPLEQFDEAVDLIAGVLAEGVGL